MANNFSKLSKSDQSPPFRRVLVANRGEIAVRIIRALRLLGIESVAVYADSDASSQHRYMADFAVALPGRSSAETYLDMTKLTDAVVLAKADAVHPGYGFLSENPEFVRQVEATGATFIGPSAAAMQKLGDKVRARQLMIETGVPVVPGSEQALASVEDLQKVAGDIGYPLIIKAAAGGGGRGMQVVRDESELSEAFAVCTRAAQSYFGNPTVFCERYIEAPRHIEFQVLFDSHGHGVHLFERDCSVQRRHQKLFEEAPSQYLNSDQRQKLGEFALAAGRAAGYEGAGTVEMICEAPDRAYFMEMNTRIQVEHPVTEMITGVDLIAWQIKIAAGEPLTVQQDDLAIKGWSMEARINSEDPSLDFAPTPGLIGRLRLPAGPFVRVDTHIYEGYEIPEVFDSMIAKVIVWGTCREDCRRRLLVALAELQIEGVASTVAFHQILLEHPSFQEALCTTNFVAETKEYFDDRLRSNLGNFNDDTKLGALLAGLSVELDQTRSRHAQSGSVGHRDEYNDNYNAMAKEGSRYRREASRWHTEARLRGRR